MSLWDLIQCATCSHVRHRHTAGKAACKEDGCKCTKFVDPEKRWRDRRGLGPGLGRGAGGPARKPKK